MTGPLESKNYFFPIYQTLSKLLTYFSLFIFNPNISIQHYQIIRNFCFLKIEFFPYNLNSNHKAD